jgi:hypothetical protein
MTQFEQQLREALRREEPSPGFEDRVLARLESKVEREPATLIAMPARRRVVPWAAAAAAASIAIVGLTGAFLSRSTLGPGPEVNAITGPTSEEIPHESPSETYAPTNEPTDARPSSDRRPARAKAGRAPKPSRRSPDPARIAEALQARDQLRRALAITSGALEAVQRKVTSDDDGVPTSRRVSNPSGSAR